MSVSQWTKNTVFFTLLSVSQAFCYLCCCTSIYWAFSSYNLCFLEKTFAGQNPVWLQLEGGHDPTDPGTAPFIPQVWSPQNLAPLPLNKSWFYQHHPQEALYIQLGKAPKIKIDTGHMRQYRICSVYHFHIVLNMHFLTSCQPLFSTLFITTCKSTWGTLNLLPIMNIILIWFFCQSWKQGLLLWCVYGLMRLNSRLQNGHEFMKLWRRCCEGIWMWLLLALVPVWQPT